MELAANTARLTVRVARMDADLRVLSLTLSEALAELSHATLVIVSPEPLPGPEDWLSRDVHVSFRGRYGERHLHGAVNEAWRLQDISRFQRMQITVVPHAWWLTERCRYRIFTETTAVDIARALWREAGLRQDYLVFDLRATPPVWQYRTQSGESEWDFLCRLFSELGWYWYFRHEADRHILMVSDHAGALIRPDGTRRHVAIHYDRQSGQSEILYRFQRVRRRALHQVRTRRYRMGTPLAIETGEARHDQASPSGLHEHFAHQEDAPDARMQAENWLNSLNAGCDHCIAQGNRADLNCGEVLSLRFPDDTRSDWLITGLTQQIAHPQVLEELASDSFRHYQSLTAVPDTQTWRPPRQTPRRLTGFWPAIVTGPEPGKVFTDDQGRVQVRFAWDPDGQPGTWLRVSQRLAGNRWGSLMLPRAGDEVSVLFLEGNPDTPVVAGRRYHSAHEAPQSLPDGQHQWMFRSRSADGTGHEVLLDDSPGNAHILLHSSGQLALRARKRYQASVQGSVHQKVAGHLQETTDGAASEQADGNWNEHVSGQTHLQAGQSLVLGGQSLTLEAGGSIHLKGGNALLNSGQTVIFKVGGAAVSCGPGGVSLSAPVVMVNMGGGGGAAATASPAAPEKSPAVPPQRGALRTRLRPLAGQSGDAAHIQRLMPLTTGSGPAPATSRPEPPVPSAVLDTGQHNTRPTSRTKRTIHPSAFTTQPADTASRKSWLAQQFAAIAAWQGDVMQTFDEVGEDPDTPELLRFAVAALKTPAKLSTGIVSGIGSLGQLITDPEAREQLADAVVDLYENPDKIADAARKFADQPRHEIASDLFAFGGEMVVGAGLTSKIGTTTKLTIAKAADHFSHLTGKKRLRKGHNDVADETGHAGGEPNKQPDNDSQPSSQNRRAEQEAQETEGQNTSLPARADESRMREGVVVSNTKVLTKAERLEIQQALQTRVDDIRVGLPKKLRGSGNMGVAQLDIPGLPTELKAHSRINNPTDKGADGFVYLADESDWTCKPQAVDPDNVRVDTPDAYTRQWDAEFKILNDVALRLGNNRNTTGSINLFTERLTCTSCTDVIFKFKDRYPNIQLNVFAGE